MLREVSRRSFLSGAAAIAAGTASSGLLAACGRTPNRGSNRDQLKSANVLDYGADRTGMTDSTSSFQSALDAAAGNAIVHVPSGTYLISSRPVTIPSNSTLEMSTQAYIKRSFSGASTFLAGGWNTSDAVRNVTIIGGNFGVTSNNPVGQHIAGFGVTNLHIRGVRIGTTPYGAWMTWFRDVHHMVMSHCILDNPLDTVNLNDGLHIESGSDISITNCYFATGDDAIALGSAGTASGDLHDVTISNCKCWSRMSRALSIAMIADQNVYGIEVDNLIGTSGLAQSLQVQNYYDSSRARLHDIHLSNCRFNSPSTSTFAGVVQAATRVSLDQVDFPEQSLGIGNATDITLTGCRANYHSAASHVLDIRNCTGLDMSGGVYDGQGVSAVVAYFENCTHGSLLDVVARNSTAVGGTNVDLVNSSGFRLKGCDFSNDTLGGAAVSEAGTSDDNVVW